MKDLKDEPLIAPMIDGHCKPVFKNVHCECSTWCRAEPQPITDKHHKNCPHYNDTIKVVKITLEGHGSYCDAEIAGALQALADGGECLQILKYEIQRLSI